MSALFSITKILKAPKVSVCVYVCVGRGIGGIRWGGIFFWVWHFETGLFGYDQMTLNPGANQRF